ELLPQCYVAAAPTPFRTSHLEKLETRTLFYIFYTSPRLLLQGYAAVELTRRQWTYHKEWRKWFRAAEAPGVSSLRKRLPEGGDPLSSSSSSSRISSSSKGATAAAAKRARPGVQQQPRHQLQQQQLLQQLQLLQLLQQLQQQQLLQQLQLGLRLLFYCRYSLQQSLLLFSYVGALPASCFLPEAELRMSLQQGYKEAELNQELQQQQMQQLYLEHQQHLSQQQQPLENFQEEKQLLLHRLRSGGLECTDTLRSCLQELQIHLTAQEGSSLSFKNALKHKPNFISNPPALLAELWLVHGDLYPDRSHENYPDLGKPNPKP
ncbi:NOT2 / NOT3 / NOT5 family domain-containing protein, putative, partial [Eimeria tenella]